MKLCDGFDGDSPLCDACMLYTLCKQAHRQMGQSSPDARCEVLLEYTDEGYCDYKEE